jgi:hypothetical protein
VEDDRFGTGDFQDEVRCATTAAAYTARVRRTNN